MGSSNLPLAGIKVVELCQAAAGPFAASILGDLGADVVKVEPPDGDMSRTWGVIRGNTSSYYVAVNRNKRKVVLDLKKSEDREKLYGLVRDADVVIENYRPGVAEKLGIDYDTLRKINPRLIYCSIKGFARGSVYEDYPAFDLVIQGMSGLMSITGTEDGRIVRVGVAITDLVTGLFAVIGVLSALRLRDRTNQGVKVEVPLMDSGVLVVTTHVMQYLLSHEVPRPLGTKYGSIAPYQAFIARDGKYFMLAVANDKLWRGFCEVIGKRELVDDPKFRTNRDRVAHINELEKVLQEVFLTNDRDYWVNLLLRNGIPAGPVYDMEDLVNDPYVRQNILVEVDHPTLGKVFMIRNPIRFNDEKLDIRDVPP